MTTPKVSFNVIPTPEMPVVYKYFTIRCERAATGRKTPIYSVCNNRSGVDLGSIKWYGPWRQYCFFPDGDTVWSRSCLDEITFLIGLLMKARKERA